MVRKFPKSLIRRAGMCVKLICVLFTNLVSLQAAAFQVDGRFTVTFDWCKHASSAVFGWVLSKQSDVIRSIGWSSEITGEFICGQMNKFFSTKLMGATKLDLCARLSFTQF